MPITTPLIKVENTRRLGGIVQRKGHQLFRLDHQPGE